MRLHRGLEAIGRRGGGADVVQAIGEGAFASRPLAGSQRLWGLPTVRWPLLAEATLRPIALAGTFRPSARLGRVRHTANKRRDFLTRFPVTVESGRSERDPASGGDGGEREIGAGSRLWRRLEATVQS